MNRRIALALAFCLAIPTSLFADFQYKETTRITGGSVVSMMKVAGVFSKEARQIGDPVTSTVFIKGNRMAHVNPNYTQIIDLDKETITRIDHMKKEYSVITFEQMKQQIEQAAREAKQKQQEQPNQAEQPEMNFTVNVRNTGATKQVSGLNTNEGILTMVLEAKDKKTGEKGSFAITNDMWMAPDITGYSEVRDFYQRWAQKMGMVFNDALSPTVASMQPGMAQGMGAMAKEMGKLKGMPVLQIMRMGSSPDGKPIPAASEAPLPPSPEMPSAGDVAKESATSAVTSKLGGLAGGFGRFGRKKKEEPPKEDQKSQQAQQAGPVVLMESNTEMSGFSSASIDAARFDVPGGYKQVEPELRRGNR